MDGFNDIPKHRKKSQAKPPKKSKHKHEYEPCILEFPSEWYKKEHERNDKVTFEVRSFCPICLKIGPVDMERWVKSFKRVKPSGETYIEQLPTGELLSELDPKTRTLPTISVENPFAKSCWGRKIKGGIGEII